MKLIALLPIKNEEAFLPTFLSSILNVVDEIVAVDNGSTDNSKMILEQAGAYVEDYQEQSASGWSEYKIRQRLLLLGRQRGGTHFLCLDADEALSCNFQNKARIEIENLKPGEKLFFPWINLWQGFDNYRDDELLAPRYKDFVFADNGADYQYVFLGVNRTPGPNFKYLQKKVDLIDGCILHLQFVPWQRFKMKQAWYRCSELLNQKKNAQHINFIYRNFFENIKGIKLSKTEKTWFNCLKINSDLKNLSPDWHLQKLEEWFRQYGPEFFESLDIWDIELLRKYFIDSVGRHPRPAKSSKLIIVYLKIRRVLGRIKIIFNKYH